MFRDLVEKIKEVSSLSFTEATKELVNYIDSSYRFLDILKEIGTIPEDIVQNSTEEKLFAKASDAVLSRAFREIGLKSTVLVERADSADVIAESPIYGYTLVADAKAFRMSRTAKNQKDFKVVALSGWRKDAEFSVLCAPYFQYPSTSSQIYEQALSHNVCLFTWEHVIFLIENNIKESLELDLSPIWRFSEEHSRKILKSEEKKCFINDFNNMFVELLNCNDNNFDELLTTQKGVIKERAIEEKEYWQYEIDLIENYTKEQAIEELIVSKKINEKIIQIDNYVKRVIG